MFSSKLHDPKDKAQTSILNGELRRVSTFPAPGGAWPASLAVRREHRQGNCHKLQPSMIYGQRGEFHVIQSFKGRPYLKRKEERKREGGRSDSETLTRCSFSPLVCACSAQGSCKTVKSR